MNVTDWVQGGIGVVALGVTVFVVRAFLTFLGNHMSKNTEALAKIADAVDKMSIRIEKCPGPKGG